MQILWLIPQILLPVIFWAGYHYYKDRHLPEPVGNLVFCFGLGIAAAGVSRLLYLGLGVVSLRFDALELAYSNLWGLFAYAVLVIGPVEEIAKSLPFLLFVLRFRAFDEPVDGIIYASFIALGYATMESLHFLQFLTSLEAVARGFAGPLVHIMFASVWSYFIARAFLRGERLPPVVVAAVATAALLHGIYDFIVLAAPLSALPLSALLILLIWVWRMLLIRRLHRKAGHIQH